MKPPTDEQEEDRARSLAEQCWLGPLCLAFWVLCILACIHGCVRGAECKLEWNPQPDATRFRVYCGIDLLAEVLSPQTSVTVTLPDAPCTVSVVAINNYGVSAPASLKLTFQRQWDHDVQTMARKIVYRKYHREFKGVAGKAFESVEIQTPP